MDQTQTPLFDALCDYEKRQYYSFHVPGHKDGLTFHNKGKSIYKDLLKIDATELEGLDDLYFPTGPIEQAQKLLTHLYNTYKSYFLVNGSTVGNLVMVKATCYPGDQVLVQRNSHKSIFNALKLARVHPVFMSPEVEGASEMAVSPSNKTIIRAIDQNPHIKAMILTYPNYYGLAEHIEEAIHYARTQGILVLVDEAHGPHFQLGSPFPKSTLAMGADMVVHSAHKTLPAMTMGSFLHLNSDRISRKKVESTLAMLQTSSPSYPIMASLDLARAYLASIQKKDIDTLIKKIAFFKEGLDHIEGLSVVEADSKYEQDPLKLLVKSEGRTGFQLQKKFQSLGMFPEMADINQVLFTLSLDPQVDYNKLLQNITSGFKGIKQGYQRLDETGQFAKNIKVLEATHPLALSYEKMETLTKVQIPLEKAAGQVAANMIIPYPPGIPLVLEGERLSQGKIEAIFNGLKLGAHIQGLDQMAQPLTVEVYKEKQ
ncbi:arginine/lysine/ornithine decarboxylase [Pullulanibacillus pueri]|uniref:Lysine decarboxylase n=1 Tax=Pullulanibacillus pueri TaxID=1437324 RepID=A0A8J2ZZW3_9BACL|nr:aminotransferase class I/II-fold pyridoxal phosphate-dependent enzyme [Pullulanibacillus pueri]MBM7683984.1 arginine/lysine/ornithine decarboxylase [Pullulanibacillus pueri]GGH88379.1 lysine decarboxylase [Pullulanibacillus pueri]